MVLWAAFLARREGRGYTIRRHGRLIRIVKPNRLRRFHTARAPQLRGHTLGRRAVREIGLSLDLDERPRNRHLRRSGEQPLRMLDNPVGPCRCDQAHKVRAAGAVQPLQTPAPLSQGVRHP